MSIKIEATPNNNILIEGVPYAVNSLLLEPNEDRSRITIRVEGQRDKKIINDRAFTELVDETDTPFVNWEDFVTYVDGFFFRKPGLASGQVALDGSVDFFSSLPPAASHTDERWIVDGKEGTWLLGTLKRSGIYKSNGSVWNKLSTVQDLLLDDEFNIKDEADNTKAMRFEVSGITTGNTRTLTPQDKNYVIGDQQDIDDGANFSPSNYTPTSSTLEGQYEGIDNALVSSGGYLKDEVLDNTASNNFNSNSPTNVPSLTYTVTQDGDYVFYSIINGKNEQNEESEMFFAKNNVTESDSISTQCWRKKQDHSIQNTYPMNGLVIGDVITVQLDTRNDNIDLETRRMLIQSWT